MSLASGFVRALEVTYGENGWHPHLHVLLFIAPGQDESTALSMLFGIKTSWIQLVKSRLGLAPSHERGVHLLWFGNESEQAARYIAKIAKEITFANSKSGRDPISLLDDTSPQSTAMFIEYAQAMYRKRAITWSQGLRASLDITSPELTDQELADANKDVGDVVAVLSAELWKSITWREQLDWIEFFEAQLLYDTR